MPSSKLVVAFKPLSDAMFQVRMDGIITAVTNHPRLPIPWPELVPSPEQLRQEEATYCALQQAVQRRDFGQVQKRDEAREQLTRSVQRVAGYIELLANGDLELLKSTGFEIRREPGRSTVFSGASAARIGPPEDFRVGLGPRGGSLQVDASRQRGAIAYEIQTSRSDPMADEGWKQVMIVPSVRRVVVDDLQAGPTWTRLRAVRSGGMAGPWTTPISVIVG